MAVTPSADKIHMDEITRRTVERHLEFEGRPHFHMVAPDWEEVAQAVDSWLDGVLDAPLEPAEQAPG